MINRPKVEKRRTRNDIANPLCDKTLSRQSTRIKLILSILCCLLRIIYYNNIDRDAASLLSFLLLLVLLILFSFTG